MARNEGIEAAASEFIAVTDDDCTVSPDWVAVAGRLLEQDPAAIFTGRVLAPERRGQVPSTIDLPHPIDYTGGTRYGVLYPNNMAFARDSLIAFGGFDPRLVPPSAEDNDLCYRWLRAGHRLRYEPALRVTHHDWRSAQELSKLYFGSAMARAFSMPSTFAAVTFACSGFSRGICIQWREQHLLRRAGENGRRRCPPG